MDLPDVRSSPLESCLMRRANWKSVVTSSRKNPKLELLCRPVLSSLPSKSSLLLDSVMWRAGRRSSDCTRIGTNAKEAALDARQARTGNGLLSSLMQRTLTLLEELTEQSVCRVVGHGRGKLGSMKTRGVVRSY